MLRWASAYHQLRSGAGTAASWISKQDKSRLRPLEARPVAAEVGMGLAGTLTPRPADLVPAGCGRNTENGVRVHPRH